MKSSFHIFLVYVLIFVLFFVLIFPSSIQAQRFNHANYQGGGKPSGGAPAQNFNRPSPTPAMSHPSQPPVQTRPVQPSETHVSPPQNQDYHATINGGSYNNNHNYSHTANQNMAAARPPENTHQNVAVHQNVTIHENVNVYHNHYQPAHAYVYHPYHPYYWGHNWHPIGFVAAVLATDAIVLSAANRQYYYDEGVYYQPAPGGYSVVPAPIGAIVSSLPPGSETTTVGDDYYYYYGGTFYVNTGNSFQVVNAPFGAVITQIPDGAVQQDINGETFLVYNNTYYQPISQDGQDAYQVVQVN
jgi:hypothetical protein